ncbi:hypothetical protein Q7363_04145 [Glaesserella parasuis]|nr:hypothetical protein [Glaesserella parasuis]MDP0104550.1 hypothetical protein [Glaesserella parasuis]
MAFLPDENDKRSKLIALSASGKIFIDPIIARLTEAELQVTLKLALIFSKRVSANTAMKKF